MSSRATIGLRSPYQLGGVTLLGGPAFCLLKPCKSFEWGEPRERAYQGLAHIRPNQTTDGSNSLVFIGPQIWNNLPREMKSTENMKTFKRQIKNWDGLSCRCSACQCLPMENARRIKT